LDIIDLACSKFGYKFTDKGGLEKVANSRTTYGEDYFERGIADYRSRQALHGRPILSGHESKDLIRGAVREMFPKIPDADLTSIVNHAFEKVRSAQTRSSNSTLDRECSSCRALWPKHPTYCYPNKSADANARQ